MSSGRTGALRPLLRIDIAKMSQSHTPRLSREDERRIAALGPELKAVLDAELNAGNYIVETWENFGFYVLLGKPFQCRHHVDERSLEYRAVDDPHYWKAEIRSRLTDQVVACRF